MLSITALQCQHNSPELHAAIQFHFHYGVAIPEEYLTQLELVARSQFEVASHIAQYPDVPVITELSPSYQASPEDMDEFNVIFPSGIPSTYEQLTFEQKAYFAYNLADKVLVNGQIIAKTYDDNTFAITNQDEFFDIYEIAKSTYKLDTLNDLDLANLKKANEAREYITFKHIKCIAEKLKVNKVFYIGGYNHEFLKAAKCFSDIQVTTEDFSHPSEAHQNTRKAYANNNFFPINCSTLESKSLRIANDCVAEAPPTNTPNLTTVVGGLIATGILAYGLFSLCSKAKSTSANTNLKNKKMLEKEEASVVKKPTEKQIRKSRK